MSAPQVSAPLGALNPATMNSSPLFARSPSPGHTRSSQPNSPPSTNRVNEPDNDRDETMEHESTSPRNEALSATHSVNDYTESSSEDEGGQDEMQVDSNQAVQSSNITQIPPPTLPSISQMLPLFDLTAGQSELLSFTASYPQAGPLSDLAQVTGRDIPTPPPPTTDQRNILEFIPVPPRVASVEPPQIPSSDPRPPIFIAVPPPAMPEEEEDDFDGQTQFLRHFKEDTSEIPPEQLEEMSRQERSGSRNFQLSALNDEHWIKQVETTVEDTAFVAKENGKFTWNLDKFHGTKESPCRERILRSPTFTIGGFKWNIKLFPHGCEGTDYVSVYLECGGREVESESNESVQPWDVAAQVGCVMFNPAEPRAHHFERASHHFDSKSPDWGWVRFYGPWQELHIRRFMEYRPVLQNDKLSITAYVRVWDDPTKLLWSTSLRNGSWNSFEQTGFKALQSDDPSFTAFPAAMSLLFHSTAFSDRIAEAPLDDPARRPQYSRSPMIQELKNVLNHWHNAEYGSGAPNLRVIDSLFTWYGYKFTSSTDVTEIWQALSEIIVLETAGTKSVRPSNMQTASKAMMLVRDRQSHTVQDVSSSSPRKDHRSVQEIFSNISQDHVSTTPIFDINIQAGAVIDVFAVELYRSKFELKKRKWCKLTHQVKIDPTIKFSGHTYSLRGAVVHRGELGSGDYYSVVKPEGSVNWLKYRSSQVSFVTKRQAIDIHEGSGECKTGADSVAYLLMYARDTTPGLFPSREVFNQQDIVSRLSAKVPEVKAEEAIPVLIYDAINLPGHQGLGFVDPFASNNQSIATINMRASTTLADVQGELLDRLKPSGRVECKDQLRLWPIKTTRMAPRFVLDLDAERWPDTQLIDFVQFNGGVHLWLEIIPYDLIEREDESKSDPMEMSIANLATPEQATAATTNPNNDVVMAGTEDDASDSGSEDEDDDDDEEDEEGDDDDGSSTSSHLDWQFVDSSYVILKTWDPQLLQLSCQSAHMVLDRHQNILAFIRETLKIPSTQRLTVYQETGVLLEKEIAPSYEFDHLETQTVILVVSPDLPTKTQEQRREAGQPVTAADWYKILHDRRNPAFRQSTVVRDFFGGPYVVYSTASTIPRRKSMYIDTKGDAFRGDLDFNWTKHGNGTMLYANGNKYEGEWRDNLPEGQGTMTYSPSGNKYEGGWLAGRRHGKGVMYYEQSEDQLRTCKICYEEEMNTVLVKCGHIVACHSCAKELKDCPVCRRPVQDIVRMWPTV